MLFSAFCSWPALEKAFLWLGYGLFSFGPSEVHLVILVELKYSTRFF